MSYEDRGKSIYDTERRRFIPKDMKNRDYRRLLESGEKIEQKAAEKVKK